MADAGLLSWLLWDPRIFLSPYCASWQRKHFFLRNTFERKALFLLLLLWYTWVLWQPAVTSSSCTRRWHLSRCREKPCKITRYFILPLPCELQAADGSRVNHIAFSQKSQGCIWHSELPVSAKKQYISRGREFPAMGITLELGGGFPRVTEAGGGCPNSALIDQHGGGYQPHQQSREEACNYLHKTEPSWAGPFNGNLYFKGILNKIPLFPGGSGVLKPSRGLMICHFLGSWFPQLLSLWQNLAEGGGWILKHWIGIFPAVHKQWCFGSCSRTVSFLAESWRPGFKILSSIISFRLLLPLYVRGGKSWQFCFSCLWLWLESPFPDDVGSSTCRRGRLHHPWKQSVILRAQADSRFNSVSMLIDSAVLQTRFWHGSSRPVTGPLTRHPGSAKFP